MHISCKERRIEIDFLSGTLIITLYGYKAIGDWGASNLENNFLLVKGCVGIGFSFLLSWGSYPLLMKI